VSAAGQDASTSGLEPFRRRLDQLDGEIAEALGERFAICREIALYKREHGIPMMQPGRVAEVRSRYLARGAEVRLPADFTAALFELLIAATCRMEDELIADHSFAAGDGGPAAGDGSLAAGDGGPAAGDGDLAADARGEEAPAVQPQRKGAGP
jgi:4-amino-4-deoxychorismate mutase